jgi:hypothetical protein
MTTLPRNPDAADHEVPDGRPATSEPHLEHDDEPAAEPGEVDPFIAERIVAIRNRYGVDGLRQAERMISVEMAIFADSARELSVDG